jgi:branched-chain amino acid transport system permease protein
MTRESAAAVPAVLPQAIVRGPRFRLWELALWLAALLSWFVLPRQAPMLNEMAILALFAVSLDLILGYAGIVSLGHAAYFGTGAYVAGAVRQARDAGSACRSLPWPRRRPPCSDWPRACSFCAARI